MTQIIDSARSTGAATVAPAAAPVLGRWRLASLVGASTFSSVYRARPLDAPEDRPADYAIKALHARWESDAQVIEMFRREVDVGRSVSHPRLVAILEAHTQRPPYFAVMPYLKGATLAARLRRGPLLTPTALWIARQTAEALGALHAAGWLHLDVKPANIFLAASGHLTLLDLGFASRRDEETAVAQRPVTGTLNYLAPELLTSTLAADERSDIYSLGVTLYEMLVGRPPFVASTLEELVELHRQRKPKSIALAPSTPPGVGRLLWRMLARQPLRRPQDTAGLIQRLVALEIETLAEQVPAI